MLVTGFVKVGNFITWLKVIKSYNRSVTGNNYNFLYNLYLFALFFPHKSYCFNIRLTVIFILGN